MRTFPVALFANSRVKSGRSHVWRAAPVLCALWLASSGAAWAQSAELWFVAGASLLHSDLGSTLPCTTPALCAAVGASPSDVQFTNGFRFGFRFGFNMGEHFGHEVQYAYSRTQLKFNTPPVSELGMAIHEGGYNFLAYATPEESRIRPFATGGVEFANYVPPGSSATYGGGSTKFGFNYGGGVKMRVSGPWAVRFDIRQYSTPKPDFGLSLVSGWVHQTEVTGGFGVIF